MRKKQLKLCFMITKQQSLAHTPHIHANQPNPMLPFTSLIGTQCHPITDQLGETKRQEANVEAESTPKMLWSIFHVQYVLQLAILIK